jgi:hypothetical protein
MARPRTERTDVRWAVLARMTDLLLPGLYAWAVTVAWPVFVRPSSPLAKNLAFASLSALVGGSVLSIRWPAAARMLGVWLFLALCTGAWACAGFRAGAPLIDPVQGIAGSLGWALFALGWAGDGGTAWGRSLVAETSAPGASEVLPRSPLWRGSVWLVTISIAAAAVLLALAFWVPGRARASFAHAAAISGAVALVGVACEIAIRQRPATQSGGSNRVASDERGSWRVRLCGARTPLILLALAALLGAAYAWKR